MPTYFQATGEQPTGELTQKELLKSIEEWQKKQQRKIEAQRKELIIIRWIVVAVVIVLLTTTGAIIQSYLATRTATYQDLVDKVNEQNVKIDLLFDELRKTNSELIELKIPKVKVE